MTTKRQQYTLGPDAPAHEPVYDTRGNLIDDDYIRHAVEDVHAAVGGRPALAGGTASGASPQISFRVPQDTRTTAERLATAEGISLSEFARHALEESIQRHAA